MSELVPNEQGETDPGMADERPPDGDITLCLSGGGFRAAIFHLGALRWLNECNVLSRLDKISCVSGGSIVGAHLAYRFRHQWPRQPLALEDWIQQIEKPFGDFVNRNIRTWPVMVRFLCPANWFRSWTTAEALQRQYAKHLLEGNDITLAELGNGPELVLCATDMVFGINWEATRTRVGDYEAGYASPSPNNWTLARAIAASSCFPPIFPPARTGLDPKDLRGGAYKGADREKQVRAIRLTDGGVYDNLGLQPAFRSEKVLVSDGGGNLDFSLLHLPWRRLARYPALLQNAIGKLRKSWFMRDLNDDPPRKTGTYWRISKASDRGKPFYKCQAADAIAKIRTDLNRFTRSEFEILINHGYLCAAEKTACYCPQLLEDATPLEQLAQPYPEWESTERVLKALRRSTSRFIPYCFR